MLIADRLWAGGGALIILIGVAVSCGPGGKEDVSSERGMRKFGDNEIAGQGGRFFANQKIFDEWAYGAEHSGNFERSGRVRDYVDQALVASPDRLEVVLRDLVSDLVSEGTPGSIDEAARLLHEVRAERDVSREFVSECRAIFLSIMVYRQSLLMASAAGEKEVRDSEDLLCMSLKLIHRDGLASVSWTLDRNPVEVERGFRGRHRVESRLLGRISGWLSR